MSGSSHEGTDAFHYGLVRLLSPSSFEVKSDGRRAKNTPLDRLRIYSRPVTDTDHVIQNCRGPKPWHTLDVLGTVMRYRRYVTITKPRSRSASMRSAIYPCWTVQNYSLDNADAGRPLAQDCPEPLIDSRTGTLVGIVLASGYPFLSCYRTARESSGTRLRSAQRHEYALPHLPKIYWKPPK